MLTSNNYIPTSIYSAELTLLISDLGFDIAVTNSYMDPYMIESQIGYATACFESILNFLTSRYEVSTKEIRNENNGNGESGVIASCINERGHRINVILNIDYRIEVTVGIEDVSAVVCTTDPEDVL
jgi:hypothetical protein